MKILLCDTFVKSTGHNKGYIDCILRHYKENTIDEIHFLFNSHAITLVPELLQIQNVHILNDDLLIDARLKGLLKSARIEEFKLIKNIADDLKVDRLIMLDVDQFQIAIFLTKVKFKISGICFRPYHRIQVIEKNISKSIDNLKRFFKKFTLEKLILSNKNLTHLFILNDYDRAEQSPNQYRYLPDPVINYPIDNSFDVIEQFEIPKGSFKILVFGEINWRKNTEMLLAALEESGKLAAITLMIIGPSKPDYLAYLKNIIDKGTFFSRYNNKVIFYNTFVSDGQMEQIFSAIDIVFLGYKNFYGSSGLLGRSAKYNKPSIIPRFGLMANINQRYNLAKAVDVTSETAIKNAIEDVYFNGFKIDGSAFINNHTEEDFVKTLLSN